MSDEPRWDLIATVDALLPAAFARWLRDATDDELATVHAAYADRLCGLLRELECLADDEAARERMTA
jgi:hypothetical protein